MKWISALSKRPSLEAAVEEVVERVNSSLTQPIDLAFVFISNSFASEYPRLMPLLHDKLHIPHVVGCGGGGVIGQKPNGIPNEVELDPALVLMVASLPEVKIHPFRVQAPQLPDLDSGPDRWIELMGINPAERPHFVIFADAMTAKINDFLQGLDYAYPESVKVGGLTSGAMPMGGGGLFNGDRLLREGIVGVALTGNIQVESIVAQGCRPVGYPLRVTEAQRHVLLQVEPNASGDLQESDNPQTALEALHDAIDTLTESDREMAQQALSIGIMRDAFKVQAEAGDFLIRNLIGVDPRIGALAIGDRIRVGQRVQFHLRDAKASAVDLENLLERSSKQPLQQPVGALIFNCLGRGESFYGLPNFDTDLFHQYYADTPVGGFFCQGEIGPIGSETFLHGYTAVFALFRPLTTS
jgi:small ligand-binding sensory domain FIST